MKSNKTTPADFKLFCKEAATWLERLGVIDYETTFSHEGLDSVAGAEFSTQNRWAVIKLGKDWGESLKNKEEVRKSAFHEVCELLLGDLRTLCDTDKVSEDDADREIHRVIRVLENVFFK